MLLRLFLFALGTALLLPAQTPMDWIQLFNGKNLNGWTPKIRGYAAGG